MKAPIGAALALGLLACSSPPAPPARRIAASFHEPREAPISEGPTVTFLDTADGLVFSTRDGDREQVWNSRDEGASWAERATLPYGPHVWAGHEGCPDLHRLESLPDGLYHVQGLGTGEHRTRVAEATVPVETQVRLAIGPDARMGAIWIDRNRGWSELMFSQSLDHGASWAPAARVNTESRRKEVGAPVLLAHDRGWVVVWTENRDPRTLFDLYGAHSPDGRTWEPSRRLNDDQQTAFSVGPVVAGDGSVVHVVVQDYRELNRFGDRDANIYYARMTPGANGVFPNVRVNDVPDAPQSGPSLARDPESASLVVGWIDARHRLTGDVYLSVSADGGRSWSPNRRVNRNVRPEGMFGVWVVPRRAGGVFVLWRQTYGTSTRTWIRTITLGDHEQEVQDTAPIPSGPPEPLLSALPPGRLRAEDRFDGGTTGRIEPLAGSWVTRQGALLAFGYGPAFARWGPPLQDLVLEGRFRLDPDQHVAANLLLRVRPTPGEAEVLEGYQLRNHYRFGVTLSRARFQTTGDLPPRITTEPITDRWLPLRDARWYDFRIVVAGRRLDYWLDGTWVLSADDLDPHAGQVVLGADGRAPVEWDDLRLYALDASQPATSR